MKRRILFVDDEPLVLAGLQRLLRSMRDQWEMEFVSGGEEALALMERLPCDVIVSDILMPRVNGAQLLREVACNHPQTVRIVLSGQSDRELAFQCIGTAHQFLSKPCNVDMLLSAVTRVFTLDDRLKSDAIKKLLSQLNSIPSLPTLYNQIVEQLAKPNASMESIGEIIARDPAMTAKVLQLVNSAFFGLRRHISNPAEAAMLLGLETIKTLVLWVHIFSHYREKQQTVRGFSLERMSRHCLRTGLLARQIVREAADDSRMRDEAMTAGLLHDIGKLVLTTNRPASHEQAIHLAAEKRIPFCHAEHELLGTGHAEVGAYLLGLWGLPFNVVEAVALHHQPRGSSTKTFTPLTAVHVANVLQHQHAHAPASDGLVPSPLDTAYLEELGLLHRLDSWRHSMVEPAEAAVSLAAN